MLFLNLKNGMNHLKKIPNFQELDMSQYEEQLIFPLVYSNKNDILWRD